MELATPVVDVRSNNGATWPRSVAFCWALPSSSAWPRTACSRYSERELIIASLLEIPRTTPPIAAEDRELQRVTRLLEERADALRESGLSVRTVAFTSADRGKDVVRLKGTTGGAGCGISWQRIAPTAR